jgi:hypothetical protein
MAEVRAKYLHSSGPDSTRIRLLPSEEKLVVYGSHDGRRPVPRHKKFASLEEAEASAKAHRSLAQTGVRSRPRGER